jgi:predicted peroxiredoxin
MIMMASAEGGPAGTLAWTIQEACMAKFLVHIHTGPQDPTKAALGFLVALTALNDGHEVDLFLAGDAVHLLAPESVTSLEGLGTGRLADHLPAIAAAGGRLHLSGKSAQARGYDEGLLAGHPAVFAMPNVLVRLAAEADTVLTY